MSDRAGVFDTLSARILSGVCHPEKAESVLNWNFLRETRAPIVKLACEHFQGHPLRALR